VILLTQHNTITIVETFLPHPLLAGPLCGDTAPEGFTVPGDHAFVTFYTDDSETSAGFSLAWSAN